MPQSVQPSPVRPSPVRFWVFLLACAFSVLGEMVFSFGLVLHASDLAEATGRSWLVTEAELLALLPPILAGPFLGRLADRFDALRLWRATLALQAAVFLLLPLVAAHFQAMVACLAVLNAVVVVSAGAAFKVLPRYSGRDELTRASGTWTAVQSAATLPAAPLGGFLFGLVGIDGLLRLDALGFLLVLAALFLNRPPFPAGEGSTGDDKSDETTDGAARPSAGPRGEAVARWLFRHPVLGLLIVPAFFVVFSTSLEAVAGVFFLRALASDDLAFGLALAAWTLGMIPGSRFGARLVDTADNRAKHDRLLPIRTVLLGGGMVMGAVLSLEVLSPSIWVAAALFLIGGTANGAVNVAIRSAVYEHVPGRFQGRTWAYWRVVANAAAVLGMVLGTPNPLYGAAAVILASGLLCLLGCGVFALVSAVRGPSTRESDDDLPGTRAAAADDASASTSSTARPHDSSTTEGPTP